MAEVDIRISTRSRERPEPGPRALELRIHGVNNTPPSGMLDLSDDAIEQCSGDAAASFWQPKQDVLAKLAAGDRGYVPPGVKREAYSWGGMARNSVGGASGWQKTLGAFARVGWMLLLPFGLVNVAYWTRRLDDGPPTAEPAPATRHAIGGWLGGRGAASLRIIGLLLTLFATVSIAEIPMDLVGVQCFHDETATCGNLPKQVRFLHSWDTSQRLALLSLVPFAVMVGLWWLASVTRGRYDRVAGRTTATDPREADAASAVPSWPLLSTRGFWNHHVVTSRTAWLHLAAVAVLLEVVTAWHVAFGTGESCVQPDKLLTHSCRAQVLHPGRPLAESIMVGVGILLGIAIVVLTVISSDGAADVQSATLAKALHAAETAPGRRKADNAAANAYADEVERARALNSVYDVMQLTHRRRNTVVAVIVMISMTAYATQLAFLGFWRGPELTAPRLLGVSMAPAIILALLMGLSLSALLWRRVHHHGGLAIGLAIGIALLVSGGDWSWTRYLRVGVAVGTALVVAVAVWGRRGNARRRVEAWRGCAPGVACLLAVFVTMTLSSALVVTAGNVLNGSNTASSLAGSVRRAEAAATGPVKPGPAYLLLPQPYVWFGVALLATVAMLVVVLIVLALVVWIRGGTLRDPLPVSVADPDPIGAPSDEQKMSVPMNARRFAQVAHRTEPLLGLVVAIGTAFLLGSLLIAVAWTPHLQARGFYAFVNGALGAGQLASAAVGAGVIALTAGGKAAGGTRPLGLLWDLICFLPRAGHPFGPPCYAERAVPELIDRCRDWCETSDDTAPGIVLSAHSLGSVIAVATVFGTGANRATAQHLGQFSLLSYGSQLRAYFGRIFPELLGPAVLGCEPCPSAGLLDPDRGMRPGGVATSPQPASLSAQLAVGTEHGRWVSLWRRTDYLGFPVYAGDGTNVVDHGAEEIDTTSYLVAVLTHSNYPRTHAYSDALDQLVE